ncbi:MAG: 23S rRNA (pseudouridine(1915)-N(3))-methyltransferase RlmH [Candidatus Magasanikbacteria bacterium]|jgi:23S rRNA (pseudouridine1915-N3)-methyltransferase|nr:23S rRNA (pseudouridine(1915)-N(3))-methyltransferase RlmH [Candidatus Magasanikbacteria bacterium]MBT4221021.1 23S rRNA (pseudouridine(1915)-N(3))-methyltransferase RlmH [Candidatus Magasanikbacteria bacterium]MBT4350539.1 23S rRNA (pseudouridine(1915)-N(3))-methyltransferase RlmH [Candidatus Magasanikbacteria bacterium]MBT4541908.1 23S rRNA (pseudouridine(1915)-N(3))-methyltransferase RlmH [Candidatus Magasanikbacteria bacterium]MBT6253039.1 23S rRNA (pseudouridine(1915)-N(3))-methyltransf
MMYITLLVTGKLKEAHWRKAEEEYLKRLMPYTKITIKELKEESFKNLGEKKKIMTLEAKRITKNIPKNDTVIVLHETGKQYTSIELAAFLKKQTTSGEHLTFIIGGPLGLDESILKSSQHQLSLSSLTFPHQMVRTILLEQIYRGVTITKGKQYHY